MKTDTYRLHRPTLVTFHVFCPGSGSNGAARRPGVPSHGRLRRMLDGIPGIPEDYTLLREKDLVVLAIRHTPFGNGGRDDNPVMDLSVQELTGAMTRARNESEGLCSRVKERLDGARCLGSYILLAAGSETNFWFQSRIDMSRMVVSHTKDEKVLRDLSARSKIDLLSSSLEGARGYLGDALTLVRGEPRLLGFHKRTSGGQPGIPDTYMLDVPLRSDEGIGSSPSLDPKTYASTLSTVTEGFGRMMAHISRLQDDHTGAYPEEEARAVDLRVRIQELQGSINALLKGELKDGDLRKLAGHDRPFGDTLEEKLLNLASVNFSQVTEFDAILESSTFHTRDDAASAERYANILGMERITPADLEGETLPSLREEMTRFAQNVQDSYQNLKESVNNSQNSLRNSVEILKTSLENKQRVMNEKREWTWNILIIVLACFGLMDAITNFMIYYLEHGDRATALTYFFFSMLPIMAVLAFIGVYMSRVSKRMM